MTTTNVREALRNFLAGAADNDLVCSGVDAADLYVRIFGDPQPALSQGTPSPAPQSAEPMAQAQAGGALFDIPADVIEAERKVSHWFASQNIERWELGYSKARFAQPKAQAADETAWLIEHHDDGRIYYLSAQGGYLCHGNIDTALRFARQQDAEALFEHYARDKRMEGNHRWREAFRIAEHMWPTPSPPPREQEAVQAQAERDSVARWSVWWNHKRKTFTTTRQAALAAWHAAISTPSPEPREPAQPAPEQGEAVAAYLEAQDALDNREYNGINAEDYFVLLRRRNQARNDLDKALAAPQPAPEKAEAVDQFGRTAEMIRFQNDLDAGDDE